MYQLDKNEEIKMKDFCKESNLKFLILKNIIELRGFCLMNIKEVSKEISISRQTIYTYIRGYKKYLEEHKKKNGN